MTGQLPRRWLVSGFAIFTLVMVAAFAGLGIWQLQRRVEKHALIAVTTLLPLRSMKSLLIALQYHHKAAPGRLIDREPK